MKVQDVMTKSILLVSADASLRTVAQLMAEHDIGLVPVQEQGVMQGIVTDRDIVVRGLAAGKNPDTAKVSEIMSRDIFVVYEDQDVQDAVREMESRKVRRLLVLARDNSLSGILSLGDIAAHGARQGAEEALEKISEPVHSK